MAYTREAIVGPLRSNKTACWAASIPSGRKAWGASIHCDKLRLKIYHQANLSKLAVFIQENLVIPSSGLDIQSASEQGFPHSLRNQGNVVLAVPRLDI